MFPEKLLIWALTLLLVLSGTPVLAHEVVREQLPLTYMKDGLTFSRADPMRLPLINIYNPDTRENEPTIEYSFEELDRLFGSPRFRQWNDLSRVCESMSIMFGRASRHCSRVPAYITPATARAYVQFEIMPSPVVPPYAHPRTVVFTDPLTPPWAPTNQYNPYWPW